MKELCLNFFKIENEKRKCFESVRMDARASISTNLKRANRKWPWLTNEIKYKLMKAKEAEFEVDGQKFFIIIQDFNFKKSGKEFFE